MMAKVVVVGSVNIDLVTRVPRLPRPGETVIGGSFHKTHGGKGANQAVAAARLGAATRLIAAIGDDEFGREALGVLEREGVDTSGVAIQAHPTGVAQIMVDVAGENLIAVASGANGELSADHVADTLRAALRPGAVVLANLEVPDEAVLAAALAARRHGCPFVLNPAPARPLPAELLRLCDVLTPNETEAQLLGLDDADALPPSGPSAVAVTRGAAGVDLLRPRRPLHHEDAFPVDVVDTTGAGDAFSATLAWAISMGHPLEKAVRLAAAAGALATRAVGARAGLASRSDVEALAASRTAASGGEESIRPSTTTAREQPNR